MFPDKLNRFLAGEDQTLRVFKAGPGAAALAAAELWAGGKSVVVLAPGAAEWADLNALLGVFASGGGVIGLPPYRPGLPAAAEWAPRWAALRALVAGPGPKLVLVAVDNLLALWPPCGVAESAFLRLARNEVLCPEIVLDQAADWGYRRVSLVTAPGEMAVRGDIFDIFAPGYERPLRLEFFGDALEGIRPFDPLTQRSKAELEEALILPAAPAVLGADRLAAAKGRLRALKTTGEISAAAESALREALENGDGFISPGLYYPGAVGLEEYLPDRAVYILAAASDLRAGLEDGQWAWREFLAREEAETGRRWPAHLICRTSEGARRVWQGKRQMVLEHLTLGREKQGLDLPERTYASFGDLFWRPEDRKRPWSALTGLLRQRSGSEDRTILCFRSNRSRNRFLELASKEDIPMSLEYSPGGRGVFALVSAFRGGLELDWAGVLVLSEDVLRPESGTPASRPGREVFQGLDKYDELLEGDLLVHRDYGLSEFGGLRHIRAGEASNDYLLLLFDGEDRLYLPVDRLNLVQRYKGPEGVRPSLDKLGGTRWAKATARARKAIEKIAGELVEMYAFRKVAKGYGYGPADDLYREFEAGFGFEETPDQSRAVQEVLEDMDGEAPMDRLVCGDVGFGKTEVALRAAFRCVLEGRQVALLCPTTVLAEQHYQTFSRRMEAFPVRVAMLSRFVPQARQKAVVRAAARGEVDVLIGTHRLLSKDVVLPNLGLLILDEEQRFGVRHKEKLKHYRKSIDVLTLTATPIPRTLQLSLSGVRALSVIETPPVDRKPVETALMERDRAMLRTALERELARGGQAFWVHNRVADLERVREFVASLVPEARLGMAHGQMPERRLEETMHAFWHGELDVLVCTAIVESGLDFPNANTLIVDQAQLFGLGQLYQLRGRVGRSERQAYAYFVVPQLDRLPEATQRRLRIILDMDYLGAGFRVAMEDLRLRGAGNILGEVQSGQIARLGLDLFLEMLEQEVRRIKGEPLDQATDPEMRFVFGAHLPGDYVPDPRERLRYYKALSSARSGEALRDLADEIRDRFGALPEEALNFLAVLELKLVLSGLQVARAELYPGRAVLAWPEGAGRISPARLVEWIGERRSWARLSPPASLELRFRAGRTLPEELDFMRRELEVLLNDRPDVAGRQGAA